MADEYRVEPYSAEQRGAVVDLMHQLLLRRTAHQLDRYLTWKYERNPFLEKPLLALVLAGDELVGLRGASGTEWTSPVQGTFRLPTAGDLVIDRHHRDRGLYLQLDRALTKQAAARGFGSLLSLSARNETTRRLQEVTGWQAVHSLETVYRPALKPAPSSIRSRSTVQRFVGKSRQVIARLGATGGPEKLLSARRSRPRAVEFSDQPDLETLVRWAGPTHGLRQSRTREFYRWRLANPDRRYHYLYWRDDDIRGFVVLALARERGRHVRIVESGAESLEILGAMLKTLTAAPLAAYTILPAALPEPARADLPGLGFVVDPQDFVSFYEKPTSPDAPGVMTGQPWQIDLLDTMLV